MGDDAVGWNVELPPDAPENPNVDARWTDGQAQIAAELDRMPDERKRFWEEQAAESEDEPSASTAADAGGSDQKQDIANELAGLGQQRSDFHSDPANAPDPSTQEHDDPQRLLRYQAMDAEHRARFGPDSYPGSGDPTGPPDAGWTDQKDDIAAELARLPQERQDFWADPANQADPATQGGDGDDGGQYDATAYAETEDEERF